MQPTNVLMIMADEHSPKMLGCYGNPGVKTPHLDRLAVEGTRFSSAYTNSPICVAARASFATGRYVHQIGCWDNSIAWSGQPQGWPNRLPAAGHRTVSIGKLHFRSDDDPIGFSERILPMHLADGVGDLQGSIRPDLPVRTQGRKLAEDVGPGETSYTAYDRNITARAVSWLADAAANPAEKPWVLFVSMICPHFPLSAPQEFYDRYAPSEIDLPGPADSEEVARHPWWKAFHDSIVFDRYFENDDHRRRAIANYLGLVSFVDDNVGKILAALEATGLVDNTRVIYVSDHGDSLGARGIWGKGTMHEESVGIPLILRGADIPSLRTVETPVSLVDIYPTLFDMTGEAPVLEGTDLPGGSLMPIADQGYDDQRVVFSEYHGAGAISGLYMIRQGPWKYVHYTGFSPELFNLANDPGETANLASDRDQGQRLASMEATLRTIVDPDAVDARAKADQAAHIARHGGRAAVLAEAPIHGSPVPGGESTRVA